jgi:hypothetical protein
MGKLNEGFHGGPHTPIKFSLNYYRTPNSITPESCFPFRCGPLDLNNPVVETRALMGLMDRVEFHFVSSLHMMKWGGVTFQVPSAYPEKVQRLSKEEARYYNSSRDHEG